jgi:hypothetical protein
MTTRGKTMTDTPHLGLPTIEAAQAQKHVTHNEALRMLDALVMLAVLDRDLSAPPPSPAEGDRYIVKTTGTGAFAGKSNKIAHFADGGWSFYSPQAGWVCYLVDEDTLVAWNGTAWSDFFATVTSIQNLVLLGVGTTADATNPMSAKLNNALWAAKTVAEGGDGHLRYKLSKESAAKTLSFLFQDNFSGRAEIGLTGDDDFHFKVSADGSTWIEALLVDHATGSTKVNNGFFLAGDISPAQITADQNDYNPTGLATASVLRLSSNASRNITGLAGGGDGRIVAIVNVGSNNIVLKDESASSGAANRFALGADIPLAAKQSAVLWYDATDTRWKPLARPAAREVLAADRTYYVRTDGNDGNNGLANSAGGAFLTIQKAINVIRDTLDLGGFSVTIAVGAGTYSGTITVSGPWVGAGTVSLVGDTTTPSNVVISTAATAISVGVVQGIPGSALTLGGFKIASSSGTGILINETATLYINGAMEYGACAVNHISAARASEVIVLANYTISGNAAIHWSLNNNARFSTAGRTVTLTGTPAFSTAFVLAQRASTIVANGMTFSGSATGVRYSVSTNGVIDTIGGGATYLPGDTAGTTATGGQYA